MPIPVKTCTRNFLPMMLVAFACGALAQSAPSRPDRPWSSSYQLQTQKDAAVLPSPGFQIDSARTYSLPELIDLAEEHNPETRFAWERAKAQAASLGIARSEWFPVLGA